MDANLPQSPEESPPQALQQIIGTVGVPAPPRMFHSTVESATSNEIGQDMGIRSDTESTSHEDFGGSSDLCAGQNVSTEFEAPAGGVGSDSQTQVVATPLQSGLAPFDLRGGGPAAPYDLERRRQVVADQGLPGLVSECLRQGDIEQAEHWMHVMLEGQEQLPLRTLKDIVVANIRLGNAVHAGENILAAVNAGVQVSVDIYRRLMNHYAMRGDKVRVELWLGRLREHGVEPDVATWGVVCKALAFHGRTDEIEQIMALVKNSGGAVSEFFYAELIVACGKSHPPNLERAEQAVFELVYHGMKPRSIKGVLGRVLGSDRAAEVLERAREVAQSRHSRSRGGTRSIPGSPVNMLADAIP